MDLKLIRWGRYFKIVNVNLVTYTGLPLWFVLVDRDFCEGPGLRLEQDLLMKLNPKDMTVKDGGSFIDIKILKEQFINVSQKVVEVFDMTVDLKLNFHSSVYQVQPSRNA